jgi:hypothetical protein
MHRFVTFPFQRPASRHTRAIAAAAVMLASVASVGAQTRPSLDQLQAQIVALQAQMTSLQSQVAVVAAKTGSVFVRWGNATAPAGTTLIHGGTTFSSKFDLQGSGTPLCLDTTRLDLSPGPTPAADSLFAASTQSTLGTIQSTRRLKCAVVFADRPTAVVWSDVPVPPGWQVLYRGYSFGAYWGHSAPQQRICVNRESFDASEPETVNGAVYYHSYVFPVGSSPGSQNVPCAVWMKS